MGCWRLSLLALLLCILAGQSQGRDVRGKALARSRLLALIKASLLGPASPPETTAPPTEQPSTPEACTNPPERLTGDSGMIDHPVGPELYGSSTSCQWLIEAPVDKRIIVTISDIDIEKTDNGRCWDSLDFYDGENLWDRQIGHFCGTQTPENATSSSGNLLLIAFMSDPSIEQEGFKLNWRVVGNETAKACYDPPLRLTGESGTIRYPEGSTLYEDNKDCQWLIVANPGQVVRLSFSKIHLELNEDLDLCFDVVEVYDGANTNASKIGHFCGPGLPNDLISTGQNMLVRFTSDSSVVNTGFEVSWTTQAPIIGACTNPPLRLSGESGTITYPEGSAEYEDDKDCLWLIEAGPEQVVRLSFSRMDVEQNAAEGSCFDVVNVYDGASTNATLSGHYCGTTVPGDVTSTGNTMLIQFKSDGSVTKRGFEVSWSKETSSTGGGTSGGTATACTNPPLRLSGESGTITYPEGSAEYEDDKDCQWLIEADPGQVVHLSFSRMDVEQNAAEGSCFDVVNVYDGASTNATLSGHYCGTTLPGDVTSTGNAMLVQFSSDGSVTKTGFEVSWSKETSSSGGGTSGGTATACTSPPLRLSGESGTIAYPEGSDEYENDKNCQWLIEAESGQVVHLNFSRLDTEVNEAGGCFDAVNVYDGANTNATRIGHYCGTAVPTAIASTGTAILIQFQSDGSVTQRGFEVSWSKETSITGGGTNGGRHMACTNPPLRLSGESGSITYPEGSANYENDKDCQWLIEAETGQVVHLSFARIDVEQNEGGGTCYDAVNVYDGANANATRTGHFCGTVNPEDLTSSGNQMLVQFSSDGSATGRGFEVSWTTEDRSTGGGGGGAGAGGGGAGTGGTGGAGAGGGASGSAANCTFENGLCQWQKGANNQFSWDSVPINRYPDTDAHGEQGEVLFARIDEETPVGSNGRVISPLLSATARGRCMHFQYYAFGYGRLRILLLREGYVDEVLWQRDDHQGNAWHPANVSMESDASYRIAFELSRISEAQTIGRYAVDDLTMDEQSCVVAMECGETQFTSLKEISALELLVRRIVDAPREPSSPTGISAGTEANQGQWPWMVNLSVTKGGAHYRCGGTLVRPDWIVTAAHCVTVAPASRVSGDNITIKIGEHNLEEGSNEPNSFAIKAKNAFVYEAYVGDRQGGGTPLDIALIQLPHKVSLNEYVNLACLPGPMDVFAGDRECFAVGWGTTERGGVSQKLLHANARIISRQTCRKTYGDSAVTEDMVCTVDPDDSETSSSICKGDSGGPLICQKGDGRYYLVGVASWSYARCTGTHNHPAGWASTVHFLSWLQNTMDNN